MAKKWGSPVNGWQYYIEERFAFLPRYMQGRLIWLAPYWVTWPVDRNGKAIEMYRAELPDDPGDGPGAR